MAETLDKILSGEGTPTPEPIPTPEAPPPPAQTEAERARDEKGRFAPKAGDTPPAPQPEPAPAPQPARAGVPPAALQAERQKRKGTEDELAELKANYEDLKRQVQQANRPAPTPPAPPAPPPDFWEDPGKYVEHGVRQALDPVQQSIMFNARLIANQVHGENKVKEAADAFDALSASGQIDPMDQQRIARSPNPFHEAVIWHKRRSALQEIGEDPAAYRERVRAELLAELNPQPDPAPVTNPAPAAAPVMPSNLANVRNVGNRSAGPAWTGPAPIKDIFARRK